MSPRAGCRAVGGALLFVFAGHALGGARALGADATTKVTVIRPTGGDVTLIEIATRAWAELNAGGVRAALHDCPEESDSCAIDPPPSGGEAITLRTFRQSDQTITEAALTPYGHTRPTLRRLLTVSDEAAADPKVTAIHAVELVNAMLLQEDATALQSAAAPGALVLVDDELPGHHVKHAFRDGPIEDLSLVKQVSAAPSAGHSQWSLGVGGALLKGIGGGLSGSYGLAARASYGARGGLGLILLAAVSTSGSQTPTLNGNLTLLEELGALELMYQLDRRGRFRPHVAVGAGGYHVGASWAGTPAMVPVLLTTPGSTNADLWAVLLSSGVGALYELGREMSLFIEARTVVAAPSPAVFDSQGHRLRTADPSFLMSLGVQRTF